MIAPRASTRSRVEPTASVRKGRADPPAAVSESTDSPITRDFTSAPVPSRSSITWLNSVRLWVSLRNTRTRLPVSTPATWVVSTARTRIPPSE